MTIRRFWSVRGASAGLLAAAVSLGVAELVAGLRRGTAGPIVSVGGWVIDHTPPAMKNFAVRTFGTNDKRALIIGTFVLLALFATVVGLLAIRRIRYGIAGVALFGLIGAGAALTRPGSSVDDVLPSVVGASTGILALIMLCRAGEIADDVTLELVNAGGCWSWGMTDRLIHDPEAVAVLAARVAAETGLPAAQVEKDFWVTEVLRGVTSTAVALGVEVVFKGGTSLRVFYTVNEERGNRTPRRTRGQRSRRVHDRRARYRPPPRPSNN